jgi:hypothetical protein
MCGISRVKVQWTSRASASGGVVGGRLRDADETELGDELRDDIGVFLVAVGA